jgi:hypothetical protein
MDLTSRPVACSTTDLNWSAMARWKRRRMSWMPSDSPRAISVFSAGVNVSSNTTAIRSPSA